MSTTRKLRLGKTESVKLTFACPATLKADLECYAALHAQTYSEAVDAVAPTPHMLEAFIAGGSGIQEGKHEQGRAAQAKLNVGLRWRPTLERAARSCALFVLEGNG